MSFSYGYTKPVISPVEDPLCAFHDAIRVSEPTGDSEPLTGCNKFPTSLTRRFRLWLLGVVSRQFQ